jgi:hypothetical protein
MNFLAYQTAADATSAYSGQQTAERRIVATLGLVGEIGELNDLVKKVIGHGHAFDRVAIKDEMGDVLWYVAELCSAFGLRPNYPLDGLAADGVVDLQWLSVWTLTLAGNAGRIADKISDQVSDPRRAVPAEWMATEITDVVDALEVAADYAGLSLAIIAEYNERKLAARYPDGFSSERSLERYGGAR